MAHAITHGTTPNQAPATNGGGGHGTASGMPQQTRVQNKAVTRPAVTKVSWWKQNALRAAIIVLIAIVAFRILFGETIFSPAPTAEDDVVVTRGIVPANNPGTCALNAVCMIEALGTEPVVINPNGLYEVWWADTTTDIILIDRNGNQMVVGPDGGNFDTFWIESVRTVSGTTEFRYYLSN